MPQLFPQATSRCSCGGKIPKVRGAYLVNGWWHFVDAHGECFFTEAGPERRYGEADSVDRLPFECEQVQQVMNTLCPVGATRYFTKWKVREWILSADDEDSGWRTWRKTLAQEKKRDRARRAAARSARTAKAVAAA